MLVLREARRLIGTEDVINIEEWTDVGDEPVMAPEAVRSVAPSVRDELGVFGLVDLSADGPPALASLSDLWDRDELGAFGLLGAGTGGPRDRRSLASCSPRDLLGALSLSF